MTGMTDSSCPSVTLHEFPRTGRTGIFTAPRHWRDARRRLILPETASAKPLKGNSCAQIRGLLGRIWRRRRKLYLRGRAVHQRAVSRQWYDLLT
jgi:hypothetical protein